MTVLSLNPPIIMTFVNLYGWLITMFKELTCESRINSVELIVGKDKWFLISMPGLNTIRTRWKKESSKIFLVASSDRFCRVG